MVIERGYGGYTWRTSVRSVEGWSVYGIGLSRAGDLCGVAEVIRTLDGNLETMRRY